MPRTEKVIGHLKITDKDEKTGLTGRKEGKGILPFFFLSLLLLLLHHCRHEMRESQYRKTPAGTQGQKSDLYLFLHTQKSIIFFFWEKIASCAIYFSLPSWYTNCFCTTDFFHRVRKVRFFSAKHTNLRQYFLDLFTQEKTQGWCEKCLLRQI